VKQINNTGKTGAGTAQIAEKSQIKGVMIPQPAEQSLRNAVAGAIQRYLAELDGELTTDVYEMVLTEVEVPLLQQIMEYTAYNQTRAARMLGINRGTLRKKLKHYTLLRGEGL